MNDYERLRLENIAKNQALLKELQLEPNAAKNAPQKLKPRPRPRPRPRLQVKQEIRIQPRRTSSRLAGMEADSEVARKKGEEEAAQRVEVERAKRARVAGDLNLSDIVVGDVTWKSEDMLADMPRGDGVGVLSENADLRDEMSALKLHEAFEPNDVKITPDRIVHLAFHPNPATKMIFSGDKMGNMGIWEADKEGEDPVVHVFKVHSRTISGFSFNSLAPHADKVLTSSYDGSARSLDLHCNKSTEIYVPSTDVDLPLLSHIEVVDDSRIYLSTLHGDFIQKDLRTPLGQADVHTLHDKKIGGFSARPHASHFVATASLDRTMKVWDLRKLSKKEPSPVGEFQSALSVSSVGWSESGSLLTTGYDDSIRIFNLPDVHKDGKDLGSLRPDVSVTHNNQTGRWLTVFRAQWHQRPADGAQKFVVGNMNRAIDVYDSAGKRLAQLRDSDRITAVPAVCRFHPTMNWIVAGTASGKIALYY